MNELSETDLQKAVDFCGQEPVHTPGNIQPDGILIGCEIGTGRIDYVSSNAANTFPAEPADILGTPLRGLLGPEIWHSLQNMLTMPDFDRKRYYLGAWTNGFEDFAVHASKGGQYAVIEVEDSGEKPEANSEHLREQTMLIDQIQNCEDEATLFDTSTKLLRHLTGCDRVMIYKFDADWNGEVVAEARRSSVEPFVGLRFPHWDIPSQARDIMARLPLRQITDADCTPVPIVARTDDLPPLDISFAHLRGVSPVHIQYLKNMDVSATMTLSIVLDGRLWGIISFHHKSPRIVQSDIRQILTAAFLPVFCLKLNLLQDKMTLQLSKSLESVQANIQAEMEQGRYVPDIFAFVGQTILDAMDADGLVIAAGTQSFLHGKVPSQAVIQHVLEMADQEDDEFVVINSFAELPDLKGKTEGLAGVLATSKPSGRCLQVWRGETVENISWAGEPLKGVERVEGNLRLQPRGSFTKYLEEVTGTCKAWSERDKVLTRQLWPLLSSAERQSFMIDLNRQQELMINELNHRVRNILSLVRSVSRTARASYGSLQSYSQAIEARIMALASAHDIGAGAALDAVSVKMILSLEFQPYEADDQSRISIVGTDFQIHAEYAPIFALVVHELTTNAVKYGALSVPEGRVEINIEPSDDGMQLTWTEVGGPEVKVPEASGFGTTLIRQAIPHEFEGTSELNFLSEGVSAILGLPRKLLDPKGAVSVETDVPASDAAAALSDAIKGGLVLVLDDNYIIASDMAMELEAMGFSHVEVCGKPNDALELLEHETPILAVLDVNLGQGRTSEPVATKLMELGIPFCFVSGYGDKIPMPPHLSNAVTLTKPVTHGALRSCVRQLIDNKSI